MFHRLISPRRDEWLASRDCPVRSLLDYIVRRGMLRDAQVEAIGTYLFLKVACANAPLWQLLADGRFNTLDLNAVPLTAEARARLQADKATVALLEYVRLKDRNGHPVSPEMERILVERPAGIDSRDALRRTFYGVGYTDYLFSLPMGAGKTFLMAAFIYIDLYFARNEPDNPAFAHNFMVLAPSGLKSSIIPSLKSIRAFDPSWVIPEPAASDLRRMVRFEVLDEQKTGKKSNLVRNPNAQKINNHQPLDSLMGLVAITNAEKVILDHMDRDDDPSLLSREEMERVKVANELRRIISRIPRLAIYIDEVHHAADSDIKLRRVVGQWAQGSSFNGVLGFSGTPYLETAEQIHLADGVTARSLELANVVYHYPLIRGVGNFLKTPVVRYSDADTHTIIREGVTDFLTRYKDTVYPDGTCAKLAIYCGQIQPLEEDVYPQVAQLVAQFGLDPSESILKYHGGNKDYPRHDDWLTAFASLSTPLSRVRIVLLAQIGKEGWDCRSLTGVILPQRGVCPTNMVLQTSCRCLRQVAPGCEETALIWLNRWNADTLNKQLRKQQDTSLEELSAHRPNELQSIRRHSRMERLAVPPIDFYQLKVSYQTLTIDDQPDTAARLADPDLLKKADATVVREQDLTGRQTGMDLRTDGAEERTDFTGWLALIVREGFGTLPMEELLGHEEQLRHIFSQITREGEGGDRLLSNQFDQAAVRSGIRRAFIPRRRFEARQEVVPCQASLLQIEKLTSPLAVRDASPFFPTQEAVQKILQWDQWPDDYETAPLPPEVLAALQVLRARDMNVPTHPVDPHPERKQTYHYLPYRFDSGLERRFFDEMLRPVLQGKGVEYYYNGDDTLTQFKINCYKRHDNNGEWRYIGRYTPDFLIIKRDAQGSIHSVAIIETKGQAYAADFADRNRFMQDVFVPQNNEQFGYERFRFLCIADTLSPAQQARLTQETIEKFFQD